jgi:hypothetical protein
MLYQQAVEQSAADLAGLAPDADRSDAEANKVGSVEAQTIDVHAVGESSLAEAVVNTVSDFVEQSGEEWERMRGTIGPF